MRACVRVCVCIHNKATGGDDAIDTALHRAREVPFHASATQSQRESRCTARMFRCCVHCRRPDNRGQHGQAKKQNFGPPATRRRHARRKAKSVGTHSSRGKLWGGCVWDVVLSTTSFSPRSHEFCSFFRAIFLCFYFQIKGLLIYSKRLLAFTLNTGVWRRKYKLSSNQHYNKMRYHPHPPKKCKPNLYHKSLLVQGGAGET